MPRFCTKVLGLEAIFVDFKNIFSAITLGKMGIRLFDDCFLYFFVPAASKRTEIFVSYRFRQIKFGEKQSLLLEKHGGGV